MGTTSTHAADSIAQTRSLLFVTLPLAPDKPSSRSHQRVVRTAAVSNHASQTEEESAHTVHAHSVPSPPLSFCSCRAGFHCSSSGSSLSHGAAAVIMSCACLSGSSVLTGTRFLLETRCIFYYKLLHLLSLKPHQSIHLLRKEILDLCIRIAKRNAR